MKFKSRGVINKSMKKSDETMIKNNITERSLYSPINGYLKKLGFISLNEIKNSKGQLDILALYNDQKYIIEIKIGNPNKKLLEGFGQALRYSKEFNTNNIIVINYPTTVRNAPILDIENIALNTKINSLIYTENITDSINITLHELFNLLKRSIESEKEKYDLQTVINILSKSIYQINYTLQKLSKEDINNLIKLITRKFDLFLALSELNNKNEINKMALDLVSYLLINQMLFYHIFSIRSKQIPELKEIKHIDDLKKQFKKITDINYKSIYQIDIITKLPEDKIIIKSLNQIIQMFKILKPELIEHDLMGRMFHDLLPINTRKRLAAFYTNLIAAEILSNLTINNYAVNVIDPACGSGTLLVSAYKRKKALCDTMKFPKYHKQFVEKDILGFDIMPFASHLSAVNLSSQSIDTTDKLQIGIMDSLSLSNKFKNQKTYTLKGFSKELQYTFDNYNPIQRSLNDFLIEKNMGAITADGEHNEFTVKRNNYDICIANPPFSDRKKLPENYRKTLKGYDKLNAICGSEVNLWGYFLALCDFLLKENGTIGFIIPINIFRGRSTRKIRKHLFKNYSIKYVIKTGKNIAFSENSNFRDIMIIATKTKHNKNNRTTFVIINENLHKLNFSDANNIARHIKENNTQSKYQLDITNYSYSDLIKHEDNLMKYFGIMNTNNQRTIGKFQNLINNKIGYLLRKIKSSEIKEGFHASPGGLSQLAFITSNYNKNRLSRALLIYDNEDSKYIKAKIKGINDKTFYVPKIATTEALRTLTGINTFNLENKLDYIILNEFKDYKLVLSLSKFKNKHDFTYKIIQNRCENKKTHMVVARRFSLQSCNTSFFAFYSDKEFIASDTFKNINLEVTSAKINTIYLNSVIGIMNLILIKEQTTGKFTDIRESDLLLLNIIDTSKINGDMKNKLLKLYEEYSKYKFPSIIEQFNNNYSKRVNLDKQLLEILGFESKEIKKYLPMIYQIITSELKSK